MCLIAQSARRRRTVAPAPRVAATQSTSSEGARPGSTTGCVKAASACDDQHLPCSTSPGTRTHPTPFATQAALAPSDVEWRDQMSKGVRPDVGGRRECLDTVDTTLSHASSSAHLPTCHLPRCAQATGSSPSSHASRWRCWRRRTRSPRTSVSASTCPCTVPGPSPPHYLGTDLSDPNDDG